MSHLSRALGRIRHRFSDSGERTMLLLTVEGAVYTLMTNLANNNNNLFASRLGASDFELSLLSMLSQLVGICVLIPGAIYTDRLHNKRKMVILSLVAIGAAFVVSGLSPLAGPAALGLFLGFAALSAGANSLYNSSWQAFFADAVPLHRRNVCYSARQRITFIVGVVVPMVTGAVLASQPDNGSKILAHQVFLFLAAGFALAQILVLSRVEGGTVQKPAGATLRDLLGAAKDLAHNKRFISFAGVALFFYMCWHLDWTMFFIGQTQYVGLDEFWLSISNGASALAQFLTIGFWTRRNEARGVRFGMVMGAFGLMLAPLSILVPVLLPEPLRVPVHLLLRAVCDLTCANVSLNILQCLLQVIGEKNRTLNIAVYTTLISISNAFLPMVGVGIYTALGADTNACIGFFSIAMVLRVFTVLFWLLRWRGMRGEEDR